MKTKSLKTLLLSLGLACVAVLSVHGQTTLVPAGAVWKYLDNGSDQGTAWRGNGFDDSSWASGPARLGYGEGNEATTNSFGPDANNKFITTYYRRSFNVADAASVSNLLVRLVRDDGAVGYLNGTEVFRHNLPAGEVLTATRALTAVGGADETNFFPNAINPALLVNGANTLAVEIHQSETNSSDLSFDLELTGNYTPVPPSVVITSPVDNATLSTLNVTINASAADVDGTVTLVEFYQASTKIGEDTNAPFSFTWVGVAPGTYTLTARATDSTGLFTDSDATVVIVTAPPPTLINLGASWKFLVTPTAADPAWITPGFDDAGWSNGVAELGYGDSDEATVLTFGPDANNKYPTTYFRRAFTVGDPSSYSSLSMTLVYDDGAVIYINGVEVYRLNLPAGPISYNTPALGAADYTPDVSALATSVLVPGNNVIAVEMHQGNANSSDLSFALQIQGILPPSVTITSPANGAGFTVPVNFNLTASASDADGTVTKVDFFNDITFLGSATSAPYTIAVSNLIEGSHSLTAVATDNSGATTTSTPVTINVVDPNPPTLISAAATTNRVTVIFSKRVVEPSATTPGNYTINQGVSVSGAAYGSSSNTIVLTTSPITPGTLYTLTVNNVRDSSNAPIAPGSQITFEVVGFESGDVGNPGIAGSSTPAGNGYDVVGAGSDINGLSDQFHFSYETERRTGDFDVKVRVQGLDISDAWAKAGLMARESLTANSRYAGSFATPSVSGSFFQYRFTAGGQTTNSGFAPVTYPNSWLRLKRVGNLFTGYASVDGNSWASLGSVTLALPSSLYVGMAVTSRNPAQSTTAQFRDFQNVVGGTVGGLVLNKEPLGSSSRKTGLVISEIMYHPRAVPGSTQSLEFVEIFNSQPFFENIGNYRLSGSIDYTFPPGTVLPGGSFLVVAREPGFVQSHYGISGVLGPWAGASTNGLPGGAGRVRLRNPAGAVLLEVNYEGTSPWPIAADGAGHSLVLARPSFGEGQVEAWAASDSIDGSPGRLDPYGVDSLRSVVINEFLAHTDDPQQDYIELYNHSNQPVDLSGAYLTDEGDTNKFRIPNGTTLPARGFLSFNQTALGFALSSKGEKLFLVNSAQSRVIDAVDFEAQENGVSTGRHPDGAAAFYRLAALTPGAANGGLRSDSIVINEIMYSPITGNSDDEYIELYNRGASPVDLGRWRFTRGITYTIPAGTTLGTNSYLTIAKNAARLMSNYANLNSGNTLGNYDGTLANGGERVTLAMPDFSVTTNNNLLVTNVDYVVVNEVAYRESGGRWGHWADGGGSSLELKDPRSDNRQPANWADSDETSKGIWTNIEVTGNLGESLGSPINDNLQLFLLGIGECLVDDVEVRNNNGANSIVTNPGFESGLTGWTLQGSHDHSMVSGIGFSGSQSLHLRAASRGDNGGNRIRSAVLSPAAAGSVTLRAKAKWLRGWPELLLRIHGGTLEVGRRLAIQPNLGTPGAINSQFAQNVGPAVYDVIHSPILPDVNEAVTVTARASDPNGLGAVSLKYRVEPATAFQTVAMVDNGTAGDSVAGDGLYSAIIPGQSTGASVAFYVEAVDDLGVANTFPQSLFPTLPMTRIFPSDAASRECMIRWGERQMPGSFGTYRVWFNAANTARLNTRRPVLNNTVLDGTFVYNNYRVIYNMKPQYAGSPWHRGQMNTGPDGSQRVDYDMEFPTDDRFLGTTDAVWNNPGNPGGTSTSDLSAQSEQTSYTIFKEIGVYYNHRRYVHVFVNGSHRSTTANRPGNFIFEDSQQPNGDTIEEWFPEDTDGHLYKIEDWFEFPDNGDDFTANNDADLSRRTTVTNGVTVINTAPYRFMWRKRSVGAGNLANDYSSFFNMLNAVTPQGAGDATPINLSAVEGIIDYEQWMRIFAVQHTVGNWDAYGYNRGKNAYTYKPANGKFNQWTWDIDFTMGVGGDGATTGLFGTTDPRITQMWANPTILRAYWRAFQDIVNGPLRDTFMNPILDAKAAALAANNVNYDPGTLTTIKNYVVARRNYLLTQIPNFPFAVAGPSSFSTNNNLVTLSGTAPVGVKDVRVNGIRYPLTWTSVSNWTMRVVLNAGNNSLNVQGFDLAGNPVSGSSGTVTVNYTGATAAPQDSIVINEIMYNPLTPESSYVEIFNRSTDFAFDLSNWRFNGLGYTFPSGSVITPNQFILLVKNRDAFAAAYVGTNAIPVFDEFAGQLDDGGETLTLIKPGATPAQDLVVDRVKYEDDLPWPGGADGTGPSLQLIDAAQDNARASNWADRQGWVPFTFTGVAGGSRFLIFLESAGDFHIDDIQIVPGAVAGVGSNYVQNGGFEGVFTNPGPWRVTGNHSNSTVTSAVQYEGARSLRVVAGGVGGSGAAVYQDLVGIVSSGTYTMSFRYLPSTNGQRVTARIGSAFRPSLDFRPAVFTPGAPNSVTDSLPAYPLVWLNEVQPSNLNGIADSQGDRDPWVELFNSSSNALSLEGYSLANNYTSNLTQWAFPAGASINAGEFKVVWLDGEPGESTASEWHANFRLASPSGSVALVRMVNNQPQVVDYLNYGGVPSSLSYGDYPDGQGFDRQNFFTVTPGAPNEARDVPVYINEWLAQNTSRNVDPADGNFDDWFELYNPGASDIDLTGYYLTDNLANKTQFQIPPGYVVPAGGYLLVWADNETAQNIPARADLHVNFQLSRNGESIGLYAPNGVTAIDEITFGLQETDISQGRCPDGAAAPYSSMPMPTPQASNNCPGDGNNPPVISPIADKHVVLGQTLSFTVNATDSDLPPQTLSYSLLAGAPAGATIGASSGLFQWTPMAAQSPGVHPITVRVTDNGSPMASATSGFTVHVSMPPQVGISQAGGEVSLSFPSVAGKHYQVEYKDALTSPSWTPLGAPVLATGATLTITDNIGALSHRFYRIGVVD